MSLTLFEYVAGHSIGIDQVLFRDDISATGTPGRMGPNTALCIAFLAIALLVLDSRPDIAQPLALTSAGIGMIAAIGYAYSVKTFYGIASYTQMAIHTAVGLVVLGLGIVSVDTGSGLARVVTSSGPGGTLTRAMLPAALLIPPLFGWFRLLGQHAGWYGTEFGVALFAMLNVVVFAVLIWVFAVRLDRSGNQAQQYLDTAGVILLSLDTQGRITLVNRYACTVLGWTSDDLLGRDWIDT